MKHPSISNYSIIKLKETIEINKFNRIQNNNGKIVFINMNQYISQFIRDISFCEEEEEDLSNSYLFSSFIHIGDIFSPDDWNFIYNEKTT